MGYSHSEYAREVFAQLSIVALIIFALIYNDRRHKNLPKTTTYILIAEAAFLSLMALKSVYDYSSQWGLTLKRLWGYTGVFWILYAFGIFTYTYYNKWKNYELIKYMILLSFGTLILVNVVNFEGLIYRYRATTYEGTDYKYIAELSTDIGQKKELLREINILLQEAPKGSKREYNLIVAGKRIKYDYNNLELIGKYEDNFDIRAFNFSQYLFYISDLSEEIKEFDTIHFSKSPLL